MVYEKSKTFIYKCIIMLKNDSQRLTENLIAEVVKSENRLSASLFLYFISVDYVTFVKS